MDSSSLSHTRWKCQYHIVFIPKYRQKKLYGQVRAYVREIIKKYIREQQEESRKEEKEVRGSLF